MSNYKRKSYSSQTANENSVSGQAEDGWIWGNHRGGGGAPIRDQGDLPNVRKALQSTIEIQEQSVLSPVKQNITKSPLGSPINHGHISHSITNNITPSEKALKRM